MQREKDLGKASAVVEEKMEAKGDEEVEKGWKGRGGGFF